MSLHHFSPLATGARFKRVMMDALSNTGFPPSEIWAGMKIPAIFFKIGRPCSYTSCREAEHLSRHVVEWQHTTWVSPDPRAVNNLLERCRYAKQHSRYGGPHYLSVILERRLRFLGPVRSPSSPGFLNGGERKKGHHEYPHAEAGESNLLSSPS